MSASASAPLAQVSRAGDAATTAFPTVALSSFGGMVERNVQLVQLNQGPIAAICLTWR